MSRPAPRTASGEPAGALEPGDRQRRLWLRQAGITLAALATLAGVTRHVRADAFEGDPYRTYTWPDLRREYLDGAPVVFDDRVRVEGPGFAVDPMTVPVTVDAAALDDVRRIVVLVDRNPIRKVLEFEPLLAVPSVSFRFKLEQASPVRAAVLTGDGRWHVGGTMVDSAGGGCTVPGATRKDGSWSRTLMQVRARVFDRGGDGVALSSMAAAPGAAATVAVATAAGSTPLAAPPPSARLRLHLMHPMDTGLVGGIPAFYLAKLEVRDALDRELLRLQTFEPVSENPVFSFDFRDRPAGPLRIVGRDNNGNRLDAKVGA